MNLNRSNVLSISSAVAILYLIPLILTRSDFQDDMYRSTSGVPDFWFENGRPLSVWLYRILNQGLFSPDISPLNFIASIFILLIASIIISKKVSHPDDHITQLNVSIIFLSSPFLLAILSYKYDSIPVSLSLLMASVFTLIKFKDIFIRTAVNIALIIGILSLYQPALSLIIGLIGINLLGVKSKSDVKPYLKDALYLIFCLAIGFIAYKLTISDHMLSENYKRSGSLLPISLQSIPKLETNILGYFDNLYSFLSYPYILFTSITISIYAGISILFKRNHESLIFILALPFILVASLGCNIILNKPAFQAREMLGVPCLFIFMVLTLSNLHFKKLSTFLSILLTCGVLITTLTISYSFLNYKDEIARRDKQYVNDINASILHYGVDNVKRIKITYKKPDLTNKENAFLAAYPILSRMIYDRGFSSYWYSNAIIKEENNINIPISETHDDFNDQMFKTCFSKSKLSEGTMSITFGHYCI
ncbi:glucosyltransferase domain-containing protein [Escherichia coli]|uniref:glucosyltransferase domain-containing protein n=1 Tax=Escherichia coli TaxID=562 RepID=UPI001C5BA1F3|nr:glucosyltransferase domain-containing protein [Escherichia coli]MBW4276471.1 glucosyltransferase domain-containing protein [Escherichia coli]MCA7636902.1 glucosyltransferase domain-containing protein [Escherichia coli]